MTRGRFACRRLLCLAATGLSGLGAGPALAEEDAAFLPAGQDAAWLGAARFKLTDALITSERVSPAGDLAISSDPLRTPRARLLARISPGARLGFAVDDGIDRLVADLRENSRENARNRGRIGFLVAGDPLVDIGFERREQTALALRSDVAGWGITASAEAGQVAGTAVDPYRGRIDRRRRPASAARYGLTLDRELGPVLAVVGASWLAENQTVLGARFREGYGGAGSDSLFLDAALSWQASDDWRVDAGWRRGTTRIAPVGGIAGNLRLNSDAWALDVTRTGVLGGPGAVSFRVSQPLRVANAAGQGLPVEYGYELRGASPVAIGATLAPTGREIATELNWHGPVWRGLATAGVYLRRDPGHLAKLPNDCGAAFRWSARF